MSAGTYGVLLVSFSRHSHQRSFVPLYQHHPRLRIVAVADEPDIPPALRAVNEEWAAELGVPYVEGVEQALELDGVDIVSIAHQIERRAALALTVARAGKHLWIDKFPGSTVEECDAVAAAARSAGVTTIVPSYCYGALVERSQAALAGGTLGSLLGVHVDVMFAKGWPRPIPAEDRARPLRPPDAWTFPDVKRELLTVGAYAVGLIQSCCDPIVQVIGHAGAHFFPEHAAHAVDDFGTLTLVDGGGRMATLCGGRIGVGTHPSGGPSQAWLVGTKGVIAIDAKGPSLGRYIRQEITGADYRPAVDDPMQWASGPPATRIPVHGDVAGLGCALEDLVTALDDDRPPRYSVEDARDLMEILIAGYQSVVADSPVDLPLPRRSPG